MSELLGNTKHKKDKIKEILKELQRGGDVKKLKEEFKDLLSSISPLEIPLIEQELLREGVSAEEIANMCDIHVELFRETVDKKFDIKALPGHPLRSLYDENEQIMKDAELLNLYSRSIGKSDKDFESLKNLAKQLPRIGATHYNREEMLCFPYLERRGITAVPSTLWRKHDEIRAKIKLLLRDLDKKENDQITMEKLVERINDVSASLIDMVFRENNILYPTLKTILSEGEWAAIKEEEDVFGYYKIKPSKWTTEEKPIYPYQIDRELTEKEVSQLPNEIKTILTKGETEGDKHRVVREGDIRLDKGYMLSDEINMLFKTLPFGITFIDRDDRVRFFSGRRTFSRTESVIGRPVQLCHPPKSVGIVNKILKAFKEGSREKADFWINIGDSLIYIQYIPIRNEKGEYLGTIEIEQDVTDIKKLEGEKRILDWK
ncbi:MAG: DUF438 domain-containing protein [Thermoplasmata archaeon]|nr:MAG: DUF438 domain-containing protein [Thermoplasmata archaeon]